MIKILVAILLTAFLAYIIGLYSQLPWWSFSISSLLVSMAIHQRPGKSFLAGFLGLALLWIGLAFQIDLANEHLLSQKVSTILPVGGSSFLLILVTGIIGGIVSGFSALTGSFLRK